MLSQFANSILKDTYVQVVGVHFGNENTYYALRLSNKKNQLTVESSVSFDSFEELCNGLNSKQPVLLAFFGKGILNKKVTRIPDYKSKVLLNINQNDFFFYEAHQEKEIFISVARKNSIKEQLELFSNAKFLVVDYSIGPFSAMLLKPFVNQNKIPSSKITLQFFDDKLTDYNSDTNTKEISIGDQKLSSIEAPLFATALNYYHPDETLVYESDFLLENRLEKNYKKYFEILGVGTLISFFFALFMSYLILDYCNEKTIAIDNSLSMMQESFGKVKELEKERDDKRAILSESGIFTDHFLSFYIQELSVNLPKTISFSNFLLFPPTKKIKLSDKILFKSNIVTIKGTSSSNPNFNNWYKDLKKIKWISTIDMVKYNKSNKEKVHNFEIKIQIK